MIRIGEVLGAFGLQGAVKVMALTDFPDRFAPGAGFHLNGVPARVEWSRPHGEHLVVKLAGVDTRNEAELLRGRHIEVDDDDLRPLPEGRWYHHDLVGLAVATEGGRALGTLTEVLVPATKEAILAVDVPAGRVTVADWLLEEEDA